MTSRWNFLQISRICRNPQPLLAALLIATPVAAEELVGGIPAASIATSLPGNGDPNGVRKRLSEHGITYGLVYTGEGLKNVSGGVRQGGLYQGKLEAFTAVDFGKLAGWNGLSFFANAFQIHRTAGMRGDHFNSLVTISNIEAVPSTRLSELWFEQKFFGDRLSVRAGQLAADAEFFISDYSKMFLSSDWPTITGANLPSGGPAYPLATPGIRVKYEPAKNWVMQAALFNGNPGEQGTVNTTGTNFRVNDPPLLMAEIQYRYNQEASDRGLAGILRLGGWHHFGEFDDHRVASDGSLLANPLGSGIARALRGTSGVYGIIDQQIYRPAGGGADSGINLFSRVSASPSASSLIDFFIDSGITFNGMVPDGPTTSSAPAYLCAHLQTGRAHTIATTSLFRPAVNPSATMK